MGTRRFSEKRILAIEMKQNADQPPEKVMDAIGVKPGMKIGEVGAGRGRYAVHMARRVGDSGKIYANDIDEKALEYLRDRCQKEGINNVEIILGTEKDSFLPAGKLDIVYIINAYHDLTEPEEVIRNIIPSLKKNGTLVIVEHEPGWRHYGLNLTKEILIEEVIRAGFKLDKILTFLPKDLIYIFTPK